jgi:hypothetical protein
MVYYNSAMNTWGMKNYFTNWEIDVKNEINRLKMEYDDKTNPNNQINIDILSKLDEQIKNHMSSQSSNW